MQSPVLHWPAPGSGPALPASALRIVIILALIAVVVSLFTALVFLYRDKGQGERMVAALAVRVLLSAALIAFLVIAYHLGWIAPVGAR